MAKLLLEAKEGSVASDYINTYTVTHNYKTGWTYFPRTYLATVQLKKTADAEEVYLKKVELETPKDEES